MTTIYEVKEKLGEEIATALCDNFAGMQLNIPKRHSLMNHKSLESRNEYIFNLYTNSGLSYEEIAEIVDLSKDRVRKIIAQVYYKSRG